MPFFSVIIPLYNKENLVEETIKSLLSQSFKDFEVIVVNDGSTDNSLKKVETLIDARFKIINQENHGASHARNTGIKEASGNYIALLDADDLWYNNHLFELKKLVEIFPDAGLFCNNYEINYDDKLIKPAVFNFNYEQVPVIVSDYFKSSIINSVAWTSSVSFTKDTFNKIGKFNLGLRTGQDIDLWIRFALHDLIAFNPQITMRYNRLNLNNLSKSEFNDDRYTLIANYHIEEQKNASLKLYLDINRFAVALRCKMNGENDLYKKLKKEINFNNLNLNQKILLNSPLSLLKLIKHFQEFLIRNQIYLSAHK
jgi:glycosyltransferase involved in cell wall biosynthesis